MERKEGEPEQQRIKTLSETSFKMKEGINTSKAKKKVFKNGKAEERLLYLAIKWSGLEESNLGTMLGREFNFRG